MKCIGKSSILENDLSPLSNDILYRELHDTAFPRLVAIMPYWMPYHPLVSLWPTRSGLFMQQRASNGLTGFGLIQ